MINNGKGLLDQINIPPLKYNTVTEEDIRQMLEDLKAYPKDNREFVLMTGAGRNKRNRNKTTGRYEKGSHYVKGGMDFFDEAMKEHARKFIDDTEFKRLDPRKFNIEEYDKE